MQVKVTYTGNGHKMEIRENFKKFGIYYDFIMGTAMIREILTEI